MDKDLTQIIPPQGHKIKAVFLDIDGTVVNSKHQVTQATRDAIAKLQKKGIIVSLATGRASFGAKSVVDVLGINQLCVFTSGALILNPKTNEELFISKFDPNFVLELAQWLESLGFYIELYSSTEYFISQHSYFAQIHSEYLGHYPQVISFDKLTKNTPIIKIQSMVQEKDKIYKLREKLNSIKELNVAITNSAAHPDIMFFNITHVSGSRENAFNILTSHWNIHPTETASFGDGESDIPFLKMSALGISMGTAPTIVKESARYITKSVEEDGIAFALERLGCI